MWNLSWYMKPSSSKLYQKYRMVTIKEDNEISMSTMPVEDDLIERNAQNRFWLTSERKMQGIISVTIIVAIIVRFSVIKHKRWISSQKITRGTTGRKET